MQANLEGSEHIKIGLIGVGGAGVRISNYLLSHSKGFTSSLGIDSDELSLYGSSSLECLLTEDITEKNAGNIIAHLGEEIMSFLQKHNFIVLVAGMGRNTGTYVSREVLELALKVKTPILPIVTSPFGFESEYRDYVSVRGEENLFVLTRMILCTSNEDALDALGEGAALQDLYAYMNKSILGDLRELHESYGRGWERTPEYSHQIHSGLKKLFR